MKYLSASRLSLFDECKLSFKFQYLETPTYQDSTTDWYGNFGSLCHEIFEGIAKLSHLGVHTFIGEYNSRIASCGIPETKRGEYYMKGLKAIENRFLWINSIRSSILGVELEVNQLIKFGIPPVHGFIDIVYRDEKGRIVIRDYKSSKPFTATELSKQWQPYLYPLVIEKIFKERPFKFEFDFYMHDEIKAYLITEEHMEFAALKLQGAWNRIKTSDHEASYSGFFCENFCGFRNLCPEYLKKVNS